MTGTIGLRGPEESLAELLTTDDVAEAFRAVAGPGIWEYVCGGAGTERTVRANVEAFGDLWLQPRGVRSGPAGLDTAVDLFGQRMPWPVLLAPTSPQRLLHEEAELATARAASAAGVVTVVSTDTHHPFPTIARESSPRCWFQLYGYGSRADVEATVAMAEESGAAALVLTVDASYSAHRVSARRAGFALPEHVEFGTLRHLGIRPSGDSSAGRYERYPLTWDDLDWIRALTRLPLLIKGVLRPVDAQRHLDHGADGLIVSNHGGRQLDGVVPSLAALDQVVRHVPADVPVLFDGGVRSGVDVIKAVALGARCVLLGRPYLWGLGLAGQAGVARVVQMLRAEFEDALRQLGVSSVAEVGREFLHPVPSRPLARSFP